MYIAHIMSCGCTDFQYHQEDFTNGYHYHVQVGTFRTYQKAMEFQLGLLKAGWISDISKQGELFSVYTGDYTGVDDAAELERALRFMGYSTLLVAVEQKDNA